ncbi:hypothetical protein HPB47_026340 [Ixodes persulcatus]|uniref:Uncharacterized protein n=1 Tax=Ixodes persulcatus TaxID=34615 RepID=A0AC60PZD2_IXOPE|nr:hypothetical protein HPB47_026340 [Ixodes persulcatus]
MTYDYKTASLGQSCHSTKLNTDVPGASSDNKKHRFWILFRYTYNVLLVFLASFKVGRDAIDFLGIDELRLLLQTYMAKLIVRAVMTLVLYPVLCSTGYDLTWNHCLVLVWVNFKGAIALSFNLVRFRPNLSVDFALTEEAVRLGLVFLLQAINTTTLPWLMRNLGLVEMSEADKTNINMVVEALHTKARTVHLHAAPREELQRRRLEGSLSPQAEEEKTEAPAETRHNANKNILRLQKVRAEGA